MAGSDRARILGAFLAYRHGSFQFFNLIISLAYNMLFVSFLLPCLLMPSLSLHASREKMEGNERRKTSREQGAEEEELMERIPQCNALFSHLLPLLVFSLALSSLFSLSVSPAPSLSFFPRFLFYLLLSVPVGCSFFSEDIPEDKQEP